MNQHAHGDTDHAKTTRGERERQWRIRNAGLFTRGIVKAWPLEDQRAAAIHHASLPSAEERRATAANERAAGLARYQRRVARQIEDGKPYRGAEQPG